MDISQVAIGYRPIRLATVVTHDDVSEVALAAESQTHVWGGILNPIIGVRADGSDVELALAELRGFRADAVTIVGAASDGKAALAERASALFPPFPYLVGGSLNPTGSGWFPFIKARSVLAQEVSGGTALGPTPGPPLWVDTAGDDVAAVMFGRLAGDEGRDLLQGLRMLDHGVVTPPQAWAMPNSWFPIRWTGRGVRQVAPTGIQPWEGLVVGDPGDAAVLRAYWNLRSVGAHPMLWPTRRHEGLEERLRVGIETWAQLRTNPADRLGVCVVGDESVELPAGFLDWAEGVGVTFDTSKLQIDWAEQRFRPHIWGTATRTARADRCVSDWNSSGDSRASATSAWRQP